MQYNYIHTLKRTIKGNDYLLAIKIAVLFFVLYFIYNQLISSWDLGYFKTIFSFDFPIFLFILLVALIPVNWGLEAQKWKILTSGLLNQSFWTCYKGVLTGLSLNQITPMNLGDIFGRVAHLDTKERLQGVGLLLLGSAMQLLCTLIFGLLGVYFAMKNLVFSSSGGSNFILPVAGFGVLIIILGVLFKKQISEKLSQHLSKYLLAVKQLKTTQVIQVFSMSVLRYCVFTGQFLIALYIFDVELPIVISLAGITWIFLIKTIAPSLNFLSDLGLREFSALYFFSFYEVPEMAIASATLLVWLLNIIIPSISGAFFMLKIKGPTR